MKKGFTEIKTSELQEINGGGILTGLLAAGGVFLTIVGIAHCYNTQHSYYPGIIVSTYNLFIMGNHQIIQ